MKRLLFTFLSFIPVALFGQATIMGVVLDSLTQKPLQSATIYVNGTTQGTATDANGRFELKDVSLPATIVFSFVGYETQALDITKNPGNLTIKLKTNDELPEIVVSGKKRPKKNEDLEYFKSKFLGDDRWGKNATIKNEDAILFNNVITTKKVKVKQGWREYEVDAEKKDFSAWASEPLIIDLPLLGYELYVDLIRFTVEEENYHVRSDMLGYFYYKPYENLKRRKAAGVEANRRRAYYSSSQHFLKSLFDDRLTENGYIVTMTEKVVKGRKTITTQIPVDIRKYAYDAGYNMMQIHGLKDRKLKIRYYHKSDGSPYVWGEKAKGIRHNTVSGMTVLEDTCVIRKDGIVMDNSILFTGEMTKKRVAACLPDDYFPPEDTAAAKEASRDYVNEMMQFATNIHQFNNLFPQEKVYLEFDNTAYFQGENIWFKAFVTHATTLERAPSGVLYVDFLAPTGQLILQQKLKIVAGQADGAIPLLDAGTMQTREKQGILAYPSGFYEIRAYTQNMLDFSPEIIFSRVIPIYTQPKYVGEYDKSRVESHKDNSLSEDLRGKTKDKGGKVNVAFYPEGGDLVKGLPGRVAFKITGSDGFGMDGTLLAPATWDSIHTVHDGMGSFIITPEGNESVRFFFADGDATELDLPKPLKSGYSMMTDMISGNRMQVNIWRTDDRIGERTALAVTCRGEVIHFEEVKDIDNSQLVIDCSEWPVGVCRVTLYNREGMVLSSRSIFHNSSEWKTPAIAADMDSMSRQSCDKEVIEFQLTDQDGNPFRDRFCLSVRDATDYGGGRTDNLQTNLLLSSDLRGYIHDPAWYLESDDEVHREALNLLTMVQGWERYEWQYMTGLKEFEEKHRIEEGLTMNGWILSYSRREPVSDIGVYASVVPESDKKLFESFDYQTDSTGYFGFDLSDFYGNGKFNINLMSVKNNGKSKYEKSKRIRFERADRPQPRPFMRQELDLNHNSHRPYEYKVDYTDFDLTPAQRRKLGRMIDDVDIEEDSEKRRFVDFDTFTSFEVEEDSELELDQGEYTTDLFGYFLERGIRLGEPDPGPIFGDGGLGDNSESGYDPETGDYVRQASATNLRPVFYVHNLEKLLTNPPFDQPSGIDMIDVKSVIVYDSPMYPKEFEDLVPLMLEWVKSHGGDAPPGIPTKDNLSCPTGDFWCWLDHSWRKYTLVDVQIKEDRQLLFDWEIRNLGRRTTTVKGFTRPVQYYSPVYPDGPIEGIVDTRRTLYWNPNVITDEDGHARVEFYNNSFTRKFTINAAGITASGIPYILNQTW